MSTDMTKTEQPVQLPAPVEERDGGLLAQWQTTASQLATSFAGDDDDGKGRIIAGMAGADRQLKDCVGQELQVCDYMVHEVELADLESGELKQALRTVLYTADGKTVSTCSMPFAKSFGMVLNLYGRGPWRPFLAIKIGSKPTGQGRAYLKIDSVTRPVSTTAKPAKPSK